MPRRLHRPLARMELDRRLAAGADPLASPALARRAAILLTRRMRRRLARELERVVLEAERPEVRFTAAIPVERYEVLAARIEILLLAAALRTSSAPTPRGVAATSILLSDGTGPLFSPHPPGQLRAAVTRAMAWVETA